MKVKTQINREKERERGDELMLKMIEKNKKKKENKPSSFSPLLSVIVGYANHFSKV